MIEIRFYSLFSEPTALITFIICFLIAIAMQLASKSRNNESFSKTKTKNLGSKKVLDPFKNFQNGEYIHSILGLTLIKDMKTKQSPFYPEIFSYQANLVLPNNITIYYLTSSTSIKSGYELSKSEINFDSNDFYNYILNSNDSNELTKKFNRNQMVIPRINSDTLAEVTKIFNDFTNTLKDYYFKDSDFNIENLFSKNTLNSIYKHQKGKYNQNNDEIRGDYNINSWSNPLLKTNNFYYSYFHNNGSEIYYIFKVFVEKYAIKVIKLSNWPNDIISENYLAIFDKIPDFSFYLNNFGGPSSILKSTLAMSNWNSFYYDKINQSFFRYAFINFHSALLLEKQANFQDISGFSYNKISLKKYLIENGLIEIVPNGLFPNDIFKDYYKTQFKKLDHLVSKTFNNYITPNYYIFYSLLDISNPYFNETMLPRNYENYNDGLFKELLLIAQEKKYLSAKWKNEFNLYLSFKKLFNDTIYQYRDSWLGLQSIDIYIPSIKIGIEYQGKQHYEAISFFGGEESFKKNKTRDQKKKALCKINGIKLIEWKYTNEVNDYQFNRFISKYGIKISKSRTQKD